MYFFFDFRQKGLCAAALCDELFQFFLWIDEKTRVEKKYVFNARTTFVKSFHATSHTIYIRTPFFIIILKIDLASFMAISAQKDEGSKRKKVQSEKIKNKEEKRNEFDERTHCN